jgi:hypothetical protein
MKNEHINLHLANQQLKKEVEEFRSKSTSLISLTDNLKKDLLARDETIQNLKLEIKNLLKEKEALKINQVNLSNSNKEKEVS